jgi:hypothetical protein
VGIAPECSLLKYILHVHHLEMYFIPTFLGLFPNFWQSLEEFISNH